MILLLLRRTLLVAVLAAWQGGFVFYGGVVVPVGADVLGSHSAQGWVTRSVTNYLNLLGVAALLAWAWDIAAGRPGSRLAWSLWGLLAAALAILFVLHLAVDALLDPVERHILDRDAFRFRHSVYLIVSTLQWALVVVLLGATLAAWRAEDRRA